MPAKNEKQRKLMGAALAYKRGQNKHASAQVKEVAKHMTEAQLRDFAKKVKKKK